MDLDLKDLESFIGTSSYYNMMGIDITDGIVYLMENGYSWFVSDAISVIIADKNISKKDFLAIKLLVSNDQTAKMVITDGNDKKLYTQEYKWTDAKRDLVLFYIDGVLILSNEY